MAIETATEAAATACLARSLSSSVCGLVWQLATCRCWCQHECPRWPPVSAFARQQLGACSCGASHQRADGRTVRRRVEDARQATRSALTTPATDGRRAHTWRDRTSANGRPHRCSASRTMRTSLKGRLFCLCRPSQARRWCTRRCLSRIASCRTSSTGARTSSPVHKIVRSSCSSARTIRRHSRGRPRWSHRTAMESNST